ncbi:SubName: Full=Uncharacterized protein {ECO:0000313/EMBL:CCA75405.1} [Serendipita indica DSM 11827]|nr:SubName: Full=Uncharacterized protein {ECO:0000313/EMBL:CCA75405.1} [Serendipita indica DSM 11827]
MPDDLVEVNTENVFIDCLSDTAIKKHIEEEPLRTTGQVTIDGVEYPVMTSQPIRGVFHSEVSPLESELLNTRSSPCSANFFKDAAMNLVRQIGTYARSSPEAIVGATKHHSSALDIWSLGWHINS